VKALATGATAAFVGRPAVWGMATGGEAGARGVLAALSDEIARTMILIGADRVADISPGHLLVNARPHQAFQAGDIHG
jgi:(S)-mandelate dehydrogenase